MAALTGISPPPSRGPPSLRCLGLGGCIIIPLYRSSQCVLPGRTANKLLSLRCCSASCRDCFSVLFSPLQMILMAYCRSCFPFPAVQGKVSLLLDMKFSRFRKGQKKPLHLLMQKHDGFDGLLNLPIYKIPPETAGFFYFVREDKKHGTKTVYVFIGANQRQP